MQNQSDEMLQRDDDYIDAEHEEIEDAELDDTEDYEDDESEYEDDQAPGSATGSDTEHEGKGGDEDDAPNEKVEQRIGELTRKRREAERLAEQRQKELEELQEKILQQQEPVVPDLPDPDSVSESEFREAVRRRDQAMQDRISWQGQKTEFDNRRTQQSQQQQLQQQQKMAKAAQSYNQRAAKLGIKAEELQQAGSVISQVGLSDEIATHILEDDLGPAIARHLASNVDDLLEVSGSDPIRAALYIERRVKPRLTAKKRKTRTPKPPSKVKGGTPNRKDNFPLTSGRAKFE